MRYYASLMGQEKPEPVEVLETGVNRFLVTFRGRTHDVDALTLPHGAVSLIADGESYGIEIDEAGDQVSVLVRNHVVTIDIADERRLRMRAASGRFTLEGRQVVAAPMPGKVVRLTCGPGDQVQEGQGLVVVEAMKMENEIKSPKAGRVVEIFVQEGQAVEGGGRLLIVE
jgi:biotin carboxyl carrier protein